MPKSTSKSQDKPEPKLSKKNVTGFTDEQIKNEVKRKVRSQLGIIYRRDTKPYPRVE
jgi:hypothetical protein